MEGKINMNVDEERFKLIDQMDENQKDMFLIGMCFHSAFLSMKEKRLGKQLNNEELKELLAISVALDRQKLKSEINK